MDIVQDVGGTFLISLFIAAILYGVSILQTFIYYQNYPSDRRTLKMLSSVNRKVAVICFIETAHTAFCVDFIYNYLITNFGNESHLGEIYWSVGVTVILGILMSGVAHSFYIRRVWIMSKHNIPLTLLLVTLALGRFVFGIIAASLLYISPNWTELHSQRLNLSTLAVGLSSGAATDIVVATSLIVSLNRQRTGFESTNSSIKRLMVYVIHTGLITSVIGVLILITYASVHRRPLFMGLVEIQSKLYANTLLASLNARAYVWNHGRATVEFSSAPSAPVVHGWRNPVTNQITVLQETVEIVDGMPLESFGKVKDDLSSS
ncbi:hypothetical protein NEOLEDRAFT_1181887 [Neolentinus lepideus HHB14362 ss-1]|uniref:DUF6534 domain-containing protein n=1 Tax=Neolentinus lepideus HHB14362 ss-1 TaxID=1314782 RepID=A0A165PMQ9_9AGAM|nr:hypothetical protein NEOLEDRAFT_1181887 [Neolentinus lepideus HHB14362 ss-1]